MKPTIRVVMTTAQPMAAIVWTPLLAGEVPRLQCIVKVQVVTAGRYAPKTNRRIKN